MGTLKTAASDLEEQRYGRNKSTLINNAYIESGKYRRKFDKISNSLDVNKSLYNCAKSALKHRSGTELEDMYWVKEDTGEIVAKEIDMINKRSVIYSDKTKKAVKNDDNLIVLHTHPSIMPPSVADFNSCFINNYKLGLVICHNGKIFAYTSFEEINKKLYDMYVSSDIISGISEYDAQINALNKLKINFKIDFWEVL